MRRPRHHDATKNGDHAFAAQVAALDRPGRNSLIAAMTETDDTLRKKPLSPAAQRALAEAEARRAAYEAQEKTLAKTREVAGRGGRDPVRYGDWDVKGLASDF